MSTPRRPAPRSSGAPMMAMSDRCMKRRNYPPMDQYTTSLINWLADCHWPANIIAVSAFICEKLLREADGVPAVRFVDLFFVPDSPISLTDESTYPGPLSARLLLSRSNQHPGGTSEHLIEMKIVKPEGETRVLGESRPDALNLVLDLASEAANRCRSNESQHAKGDHWSALSERVRSLRGTTASLATCAVYSKQGD